MRLLIITLAALVLVSGCASHVTPAASVDLAAIDRADIAEAASRKPSPNFPARIAVGRVQAPDCRSHTADASVSGRFSVITAQERLAELEASRQGTPMNVLVVSEAWVKSRGKEALLPSRPGY